MSQDPTRRVPVVEGPDSDLQTLPVNLAQFGPQSILTPGLFPLTLSPLLFLIVGHRRLIPTLPNITGNNKWKQVLEV